MTTDTPVSLIDCVAQAIYDAKMLGMGNISFPDDYNTLAKAAIKAMEDARANAAVCRPDCVPDADIRGKASSAKTLIQKALERLVILHSCEQEGMGCGMPSPDDWIKAVDEAAEALAADEPREILGKCPDCGADMVEVCSGLEGLARGDAASSCRHSDYCEKPQKRETVKSPPALVKAVIAEIDRLATMTPDELHKEQDVGFMELLDMALTLRNEIEGGSRARNG